MPHTDFSTVGPRALIRAKHVTELQDALRNTPTLDDLPSMFTYLGWSALIGDRPASASDGEIWVVGTGDAAIAYLWDDAAWVNLGSPTMGAPGPAGNDGDDGADGVGSIFLDNALGAAFGYLLGDGQVTFTVGGEDGLPIPAAIDLLVEGLERDGYEFGAGGGGAVDSVNGQTGAVVLDAADVDALPDTTDIDDLLPAQTGQTGKVLTTNGTAAGWGDAGNVDAVNGQSGDVDLPGAKPVMLSLPYGALRGQPTLSRPITDPILTLAEAGTTSIFQPQLIDLRLSGGAGATSCGLIWSTDHDSVGGINLATAAHPFGPYTVVGQVYVDTTHGNSCETPHAVWDEAEGHWKVYYQMYNTTGGGLSPSSQYTCLATTPDFETFTYVDIVIEGVDNDEHGNQHTGYAVPFKLGDTWISYSLFGGGTALRHAMWQSADGITWYLHPWKTGHNTPQIDHVSGWTPNFRGNIGGAPIWYRGRYWLFTAPVLNFAGVNTDPLPLAVAPLSEDFRHFAGRPISLDVSPVYAWEGDGPTYFGASLMWDEHIYFPYRAGDNDAFGLWEIS